MKMQRTFTEWFSMYFKRSSWLKMRRQTVAKKFEDVHPEFLFVVDWCYHLVWGLTIINSYFFLRYVVLEIPFIATVDALKIIVLLIDIPISFFCARMIGVSLATFMLKMKYRKY